MIDPTRLIEEAGGDPLESSLLQLARNEGPSTDGRRKILAAIAAAGTASLATQQAKAASTAGKGMTVAKWGALAVAVVAIPAAILLRGGDDAPTPTLKPAPSALKAPATEVQVTPTPGTAAPAEAPAPLALEDLPTLPSVTSATGSAPSGKQPQGSLADEVAQLQKAKLALKAGSPTRALAELVTYGQRFPRPMLGAEATVLRIEALSQTGDGARAKTLAEGFLAKNPNSPYAARLRSLTGAH